MEQYSRVFDRLITQQPVHKYRKGNTIFFQGEVPNTAYLIKKGVARSYGISNEGEERIVSFHAPGDLLPAGWLFGVSKVCLYYYDAFTDCELVAMSKHWFNDQIQRNPDLKEALFGHYMKLYVGSTLHIHALEHAKAQEKIVRILHFLVLRFGKEKREGIYTISLRLTHQDIAATVGVSRETAAIELGKLRDRKIISYSAFQYTVNLPALLRVTGGDEFKEVAI